jgi:hypothetical protein
MSAINRATLAAICGRIADHHAVAMHYSADGGHSVMRSQTTTYPTSWVDLGATSRPLCGMAYGQRHAQALREGAFVSGVKQTPPVPRRRAKRHRGPCGSRGTSRRAALQRCGQGEVGSAVRRQLANAALSSGRTTYSHGSGAALPAQREAAYSHQERAALPARREAAYSHGLDAALPARREAAYSHGLDAALPARREAAYSHPKAFEAWTVQACRSLGATMATPTRGMSALLQ